MKITITFILTLTFSVNVFGQASPSCNDLIVENIQMDDDTVNLVKVTISNSCSTCASGINGCVYSELRIIKTVSPFDTIASSNCFCLWSPDNSNQKTYFINSTVSSLPSLTDIRVSFMNCGCDTIPYSITLKINENILENNYSISPNPFSSSTIFQTDKVFKDLSLTLYNSFGLQVKQIKNNSGQTITLHRDNLPSGLYFIRLTQDNKTSTTNKLIITD